MKVKVKITHHWCPGRRTRVYGRPRTRPQFECPPSSPLSPFHRFAGNSFLYFQPTVIKLKYVPGQEPPILQTPRRQPFQQQFPSASRNRSPCWSSAFSSLPPGILQDWHLRTTLERQKRNLGRRGKWEAGATCSWRSLVGGIEGVGQAPIKAPQILLQANSLPHPPFSSKSLCLLRPFSYRIPLRT